ncbi:TetR/AcrR family transcriptional regulator [Allokutzneria multivorans]|uniref:TetR/AcrR family transcriptional regulator n=1 Tax=Allokutzneria multivorans TaxID=1142134 RepID=A0ABP7R0W7_9PSEU
MPIDHDQRRAELADAVWRIVLREGVPAASVRGVAREAGLSTGSVRYFFTTQDELLRFAMREVVSRAERRVQAGAGWRTREVGEGDPIAAGVDLLKQVLPLDAERLTEARVWFAFTAHGTTDPDVRRIRQEADEGVKGLCRTCVSDLDGLGLLGAGRDLALEAERLWALLDGLTLHVLLAPEPPGPDAVAAVLDRHLRDLGLNT